MGIKIGSHFLVVSALELREGGHEIQEPDLLGLAYKHTKRLRAKGVEVSMCNRNETKAIAKLALRACMEAANVEAPIIEESLLELDKLVPDEIE